MGHVNLRYILRKIGRVKSPSTSSQLCHTSDMKNECNFPPVRNVTHLCLLSPIYDASQVGLLLIGYVDHLSVYLGSQFGCFIILPRCLECLIHFLDFMSSSVVFLVVQAIGISVTRTCNKCLIRHVEILTGWSGGTYRVRLLWPESQNQMMEEYWNHPPSTLWLKEIINTQEVKRAKPGALPIGHPPQKLTSTSTFTTNYKVNYPSQS